MYFFLSLFFFFFNDTATTEIYTLSLHDALPISSLDTVAAPCRANAASASLLPAAMPPVRATATGRCATLVRRFGLVRALDGVRLHHRPGRGLGLGLGLVLGSLRP